MATTVGFISLPRTNHTTPNPLIKSSNLKFKQCFQLGTFHCLHHQAPFSSQQPSKTPQNLRYSDPKPNNPSKSVICSSNLSVVMDPQITKNFGFNDLMGTVTVDVQRAEGRPLNVPLIAPFTIASSRLDKVENVGIRVELSNGSVGWGEAPVLPSVTAEDQATALAKAAEACLFLKKSRPMTLRLALQEIGYILPGHQFASVRAGVEMALIDAVAKTIGVPLWRLFGGLSNTITTDITIPIGPADIASTLALQYKRQGFKTLKLKVGKSINEDIKVLTAIREVYPDCLFILDANEGYNQEEAVRVLQKLHEMGVTPILFEQPVHRDDWEGLGYVSRIAGQKYGVSVAADESCRCLADAKKIVQENLAGVINIKLAKLGVLGALQIIELVRTSRLSLMIGGMVETRLAMGFAGHLAAGMGCFQFIDLDTPILLSEDPVFGGYEVSGAAYTFTNARGHGGFLHWDNIECAVVVVLLMLAEATAVTNAVSCSPIQLSPCANAIVSSSPPTSFCCTKIRQQKPCLCQYMRNPTLRQFINTPNAKKVARTCGTPFPRC